MFRAYGYTPAPKKMRLVIFMDQRGNFTDRYTHYYDKNAWILEVHNLKTQGFTPIFTVNIPFRYWLNSRQGYDPVYRFFVHYAKRINL